MPDNLTFSQTNIPHNLHSNMNLYKQLDPLKLRMSDAGWAEHSIAIKGKHWWLRVRSVRRERPETGCKRRDSDTCVLVSVFWSVEIGRYIGGLLSQAPVIDMKCNVITGMGAVARSPFASAIYHHRWTRLALARLLIPFISRSCHGIDYGDKFTSRCRKFENRVTSRISRIARSQLIAHKW